jgi:inward rectifier potassium channel
MELALPYCGGGNYFMKQSRGEETSVRAINPDGTLNLRQHGNADLFNDPYHFFLAIGWPRFLTFLIAAFFLINLFFGLAYFLLGREGLHGITSVNNLDFFLECVFFSVQTFSTIGYGQISPVGIGHNILVSLQAFLGLMSIGLMSGLFFSRFSRPTTRVKFSDVALITPYLGQKTFLFRLANGRLNHIVDASINVTLARFIITPEGISLRQMTDLKLIRERSSLFALSWTVGHQINETSPIYGMLKEDFKACQAEFIVSLTGHDETFSQTVHARHSYIASDIEYDRHFEDFVKREGGKTSIKLDKISELRDANFSQS